MRIAAVVVSLLLSVVSLQAQSAHEVDVLDAGLREQRTAARKGVTALADCPATAIFPSVLIQGQLTTASCRDFLDLREDVYAVNVTAGQTIVIDYSSPSYETFLYMYLAAAFPRRPSACRTSAAA